ncbi:MAG: threonine synthase [Candidatus Aenigmarchaeota archaeon]|nr:threonine synthase [Candidatus Aenigmarchaeota archaeon]
MGMQYRSTMGKDPLVDMRTMVFKGKPDDGGLYMPVEWDRFSNEEIYRMRDMSIPEIGYEVGKKFFGKDLSDSLLQDIAENALTFGIPIEHVEDNIYLMRLDQGPTGAFKDFAAQYMAQTMKYYSKYLDKEMVIIVATSGDTGASIAKAFHRMPGFKVYVMYPEKEISRTQAALMDILGDNVYVRSVDEEFDSLQDWAQALLKDNDMKHISRNSANSIHLLRLLPQTIYHLYGSSRMRDGLETIIKSDACGNFGNMTADVIAMKYMGNPIGKILVATNENDEFPVFMATGLYKPIKPSRKCLSNAMNVGNPSNLRRLFDIYKGSITGEGEVLKMPWMDEMRKDLFAISISDKLTKRRIKETWKEHRISVEPHGSVALEAAYRYRNVTGDKRKILVTETAAPWKFPNILDNMGIEYEVPEWVQKTAEMSKFTKKLPGDYQTIKEDFLGTFG